MRPLNLGQTLDAAWNLTLRHFKVLAVIVLAFGLPAAVLQVWIISATTEVFDVSDFQFNFTNQENGVVTTSDEAFAIGQVAIVLIQTLVYVLAVVSCIWIVAEAHAGRSAGAKESLGLALRRSPQILWTGLLSLMLIVLSIVTIIGPIWLSISWAFAFAVVLIEGKSGWPALKRSFQLVEGRWWRTLGRLLVGALIVGIGSSLVTGILVGLVSVAFESTSFAALVGYSSADLIGRALTLPFSIALTTVVYFDLRARQETVFTPPDRSEPPAARPEVSADAGPGEGGELFGGFAPPAPPGRNT